GVELIATGGTAKALAAAGLEVTEVAELTGFPEIMDGRVKTLHPTIHGGLLAVRDNPEHRAAMSQHGIAPIDLLAVNLYPFERTLAEGADFATCIENVDIGGPALLRAAAKNHAFVTVVCEPEDYAAVLAELHANDGATGAALRQRLARRAYAHTAAYDSAIANWLAGQEKLDFSERLLVAARLGETLRYGENPHQAAAFYRGAETRPGVASARQLQGKELSYNNLNDTDAAYELVAEFAGPAAVIVKHANPCGVAEAKSPLVAYKAALACDPVSAFGGIVALNRPLDPETARALSELFLEVVIAPEIGPEAARILAAKKSLRLLEAAALPDPAARGLLVKSLAGGYLVQE
ncbi:MAG: bifunctional phosphoribosylaminoimidazolecarboxamide formyltransferase/IMP cyclohydrolase, partial [Burkholderiales bacterium]